MVFSDWDTRKKGAVGTLLLVFACFTLSTSGYLGWLYHLMEFVPPESVDMLSMGAGYACQGVGIAVALAVIRSRPETLGRMAFIVLVTLHFACAAPAALSDSLGGTLAFGYAMNLLCGAISAFYLLCLASLVGEKRRGVVFGGGYACSIVASWLLSMVNLPSSDVPMELVSCIVFSVVAVGVTALFPGFLNGAFADGQAASGRSEGSLEDRGLAVSADGTTTPAHSRESLEGRSLIALAAATVLLMSIVKNMGFNFPTADIGNVVNVEFSRLFYAAGLVIAGVVIDRDRKLGAILCVAALFVPFALIALSGNPVSGAVLWAVDYFFYGFYSVFRVVLFADLAFREKRLYLAGFGLMIGHFGDALGTVMGLSLGGNAVALVTVTAALFAATVFVFYQLFQQLFMAPPAPARSEREIFDAFSARYELSPREREVVRLALDDKANADIAAVLFVPESTVKYHMRNALKKTGCKNRSELLAKYANEG